MARMSNVKSVEAIRKREIFTNNGSTITGASRFRGWGDLPEKFRPPVDLDEISYWIYSYDTPIGWVPKDGKPWMPPVRFSTTTTKHQDMVAVAWGIKFEAVEPLTKDTGASRYKARERR